MNYKSRLQKTEGQTGAEQLAHDVEQAELQAKADLLATKLQLSKEKQKLENLRSSKSLSLSKIVEQTMVVSDYQKGYEIAEKEVKELFGDS